MGRPQNVELLQRIVPEAFYSEIEAAANERVWPKIAQEVPQDVGSAIRTSMGAVQKPRQSSKALSGAQKPATLRKDYKFTTEVVSWQVTEAMDRDVAEDLPDEVARTVRNMGASTQVFFDERAIGQLGSTTALGYDGDPLYSDTHDESGTSQDNSRTSAGTPTVAQIETALEDNLATLMDFRDDQGRPVNEGVSGYLILVNPLQFFTYKTALDPMMRDQAIDSSGGKGTFRGMFDIVPSSYVPSKTHYVFAKNRTRRALAYITRTPWDIKSNIGTDSDAWNHDNLALFTGFARFEFLPWDWKTTIRHVFT